jgi:hypothetical protein
MKLNRRNFIRNASVTAAGAGVFSILPSEIWSSAISPSDKVNIALIGCNRQGFWDLKCHLDSGEANCVAICDVDSNVLKDRAAEVAAMHAHIPNIAARTGEPVLIWNEKNSAFSNSEKANALIKPEYRAPWKFPFF